MNEPDARPINLAPYSAGPAVTKIENRESKKMSNMREIEPALVRVGIANRIRSEKDGALRFCVDYRKINYLTVKEAY